MDTRPIDYANLYELGKPALRIVAQREGVENFESLGEQDLRDAIAQVRASRRELV